MSRGPNRGRYVVALGGPWRLYTHPLPGWHMLGTVQRGMQIGALGRSPAEQLAQVNAGTVTPLDQRKAAAALAASQEPRMSSPQPTTAVIPDGLDFSALRLARDPATGDVSFDWTPIERICEASGMGVELFRSGPEDNVASLITAWYREHLARGGAPDAVQEDLIAEAALEDQRGGGLSHPPGRA